MKTYILLFISFYSITYGFGQIQDTIMSTDPTMQIIEEFIENTETEAFDFTDFQIELEAYLKRPLNLNKASREQLELFPFLDPLEIDGILYYRNEVGEFISIYELQAIPELDMTKISVLSRFVTVDDLQFDVKKDVLTRIKESRKEFFAHTTTGLQKRRGLTSINGQPPRYLGDPNRYYLRFRGNYENKFSYGFAAEKDIGEPWQKQGFDYYTAHIFIRDVNRRIKTLALGDYNVSLGQGLILHTGFGRGKSIFTTQVKKGGYVIRPSTGVNEFLFFRGAAITLRLPADFELTLFGSHRGIDASVRVDSIESGGAEVFFSSIQSTGLHRTETELANKNAIRNTSVGGNLKFTRRNFNVSANALYDRFSAPLIYTDAPYNRFRASGRDLLNVSVDYTYIMKNLHFYGETAMSDNGGLATLNGLLLGLHPKANAAIVYRNFQANYQNINGNTFSETISPVNEEGIYLGTEIKPNNSWNISFYGDFFKHPWLRFNADAPSYGQEFLGRVTYRIKRKMETYLHLRYESKERNFRTDDVASNILVPFVRQQFRWHIEYVATKGIVLRNRVEFSKAGRLSMDQQSDGFMILQDIIYKPVGSPLSFTGRIALFQTDDFDSRIYAYENDLVYNFSIPPYFGQGMRTYLNLRYTGLRNLSVEARIANTKYFNQSSIGSGNDLIEGNNRTDIRFQIIYRI